MIIFFFYSKSISKMFYKVRLGEKTYKHCHDSFRQTFISEQWVHDALEVIACINKTVSHF